MSEWRTSSLGSVCLNIADCEHKTAPIDVTGEYFAVGSPAMKDNVVDYKEARRISSRTFEAWTRRLRPRLGDLLIAREAPVGPVIEIPETENVAPGQRTVLLRPDPTVVHSRYLYFLLTSRVQQALLQVKAAGSTVSHLNVADLRDFPISLPSLGEQRGIAEVLGALDDKIAANTRLKATLEAYVSAAFGALRYDRSASVSLGTFTTTVKGVSYRSVDLAPSGTALVTLKSFVRTGGYTAAGLKPYTGPFRESQRVSSGELAVAQTDLTQAADVVGRAIRIPRSREFPVLVASLDLVIVRPHTAIPEAFLFGLLLDPRFREHCKARTSGTTVLHLSSDAIASYPAPHVPREEQSRYAAVVAPVLEQQESLAEESRVLAATRDALLPALMSGRLRVKDAEAAAEAWL